MASPGNRHCADCNGTLSFPMGQQTSPKIAPSAEGIRVPSLAQLSPEPFGTSIRFCGVHRCGQQTNRHRARYTQRGCEVAVNACSHYMRFLANYASRVPLYIGADFSLFFLWQRTNSLPPLPFPSRPLSFLYQ